MRTSWSFGGVLLVGLSLLVSCDQNYFEKQYFRSTEYYFPDSSLRQFAMAAAKGNTLVLDQLVAAKSVEVDQRGNEGMTPLAWAIGANNLVAVDWLLIHGANPDRVFYGSTTPLTVAVYLDNLGIVKRLLKAGAQPDLEVDFNRSPLGKAVIAASPEIVEALLESGANPNGIEGEEGRPLVTALEHHRYQSAALLLSYKADPRLLPNMEDAITAWMAKEAGKYASEAGYQDTVKALVALGLKLTP